MGKTIADVLQLRWKTLFWHLLKLCLFSVSSHQKWSKVSGAVKLRCVLLNQNCWLNLPLTAVHPQGDFVLLYANEFVAFSEFFYCIYGSVNCSHQRSARRIWIIRVCCVLPPRFDCSSIYLFFRCCSFVPVYWRVFSIQFDSLNRLLLMISVNIWWWHNCSCSLFILSDSEPHSHNAHFLLIRSRNGQSTLVIVALFS